MLVQKIDKILAYIESKEKFLEFNETIFNILEGELLNYVNVALKKQLLSDNAYESAREGISPINIIKKFRDKLTKLYAANVVRKALVNGKLSKADQDIVDWYVDNLNLNKHFNNFNGFLNTTKTGFIEPYLTKENDPKLRTIPSHQFLVYSDDPVEPNRPTIFIKIMGKRTFEKNGKKKDLDVYFLYSADEFLAINSDGDILKEFTQQNKGVNVYGTLPGVYGNTSDYLLMPKPDTDLLQIGTLIPLMFTFGNDALKYMSYSILYGIDIDAENLERNPNVFWVFKSDPEKKPKIGQIKPEVDVSKIIENIMVQLDAWLETKGIKPSNAGNLRADNNLSGASLLIKEMDTTQALKDQIPLMAEAENNFWKMMAKVHNYWVSSGIVRGLGIMNENISVKVEYELPRAIESEDELLERSIKAKNNNLVTTRGAIAIWKPKLTDKELDQRIKELEEEFEEKIKEVSEKDLKNEDKEGQ